MVIGEGVVNQVKRVARTRAPRISEQSPTGFFNSGSVMLNLACSDKAFGGFAVGKMVNLIGDSSSGKTLLALSMLAEIAHDKRFDDYKLIYDDVEAACEFDLEKLFGKKTADRVEPPIMKDGLPVYSDTIQDFQMYVHKRLVRAEPFVWVLDSFDALTADEEVERVKRDIEARERGRDVKGSYKMEKAKIIGEILRQIVRDIKQTKSGLVIVSQTRDNIDPMSFQKKTRSGGNALRFYASHEIWLAVADKIKSKDRVIGANIKAKVTKNKITGKLREVSFPIYYDYGVDNIGSCIDFLVGEKVWQERKNIILAESLGLEGTRQKLIREIEEKGLERKLFAITEEAWQSIEESVKLNRKPKFSA